MVLHDQFSETDNSLMIGHVGVMLPTSDAVYFVEKVAFQEPYRLLKFKNRTELSDYLMLKYDNSWGQDTAHTFITDNENKRGCCTEEKCNSPSFCIARIN